MLIKRHIKSMKRAFKIDCEMLSSETEAECVARTAERARRRNEKKCFLKIDSCCLRARCRGILKIKHNEQSDLYPSPRRSLIRPHSLSRVMEKTQNIILFFTRVSLKRFSWLNRKYIILLEGQSPNPNKSGATIILKFLLFLVNIKSIWEQFKSTLSDDLSRAPLRSSINLMSIW